LAPIKLPLWAGCWLPAANSGLQGCLVLLQTAALGCRSRRNQHRVAGEISHLMVRGIAYRVKPAGGFRRGSAPQKARYCSVTWGLRT
jgi:hypothetical protein